MGATPLSVLLHKKQAQMLIMVLDYWHYTERAQAPWPGGKVNSSSWYFLARVIGPIHCQVFWKAARFLWIIIMVWEWSTRADSSGHVLNVSVARISTETANTSCCCWLPSPQWDMQLTVTNRPIMSSLWAFHPAYTSQHKQRSHHFVYVIMYLFRFAKFADCLGFFSIPYILL